MRLWLGLGNPGAAYARSRHNIGFLILDAILARYQFPPAKEKFGGLFSLGEIGGEKVAALKPMTYMNLSGQSAGEASRFYKIETKHVLAFHDEIDLPFGKIRMKEGGGAAGHNGIRSLISHLGADFWRLRAGVAHPGDGRQVKDYVLGDFSKSEVTQVETLASAIADHAPLLAQDRADLFSNRLHLQLADSHS